MTLTQLHGAVVVQRTSVRVCCASACLPGTRGEACRVQGLCGGLLLFRTWHQIVSVYIKHQPWADIKALVPEEPSAAHTHIHTCSHTSSHAQLQSGTRVPHLVPLIPLHKDVQPLQPQAPSPVGQLISLLILCVYICAHVHVCMCVCVRVAAGCPPPLLASSSACWLCVWASTAAGKARA